MPLILVRCSDCGYDSEHRVGMVSGELRALLCLNCESDQTTRIMAAANLKRDGTYSYRGHHA
jgi:hypothetical protein